MPNPWMETPCTLEWCEGNENNPETHTVGDDLRLIERRAIREFRLDVLAAVHACMEHQPQHVFPDGRIVGLGEHIEFVALAREASTDPPDPEIDPDWVACIQALQHEGTGGGTAIRDKDYADEQERQRKQRWQRLLEILERRREGHRPPPW